MLNNSNVKKVCGFYVSNIHLTTMVLPYIKNQIEMDEKFETILEYNLKEYIDKILSNLIKKNKIF